MMQCYSNMAVVPEVLTALYQIETLATISSRDKVNVQQQNRKQIYENYQIQYSQRHSVVNHCDRHITLLSDTDTVQSET